jgi:hypothetical protein
MAGALSLGVGFSLAGIGVIAGLSIFAGIVLLSTYWGHA